MEADLTLAICAYNASRFLIPMLESVCAQTMQRFHLLIVDDCSTDGTKELVYAFFRTHPRPFKLVSFSQNRGVAYARCFAERHVETTYMMFLDADDILLPEAVARMYGRISSDDTLMAVGCYLDYIDAKGKRIGGGLYLGDHSKEDFFKRAERGKLMFLQATTIYRRECSLAVGGFVSDDYCVDGHRLADYCEDLDLWTRMSDLYREGKAIIVIPEVLALYRKGLGLSTSSFWMILKMRYVKHNLQRRRSGQTELSFRDFYELLSEREIKQLDEDSRAADNLRNGVFALRMGHGYKGARMIISAMVSRPGYFYDKLKNNLFRR